MKYINKWAEMRGQPADRAHSRQNEEINSQSDRVDYEPIYHD